MPICAYCGKKVTIFGSVPNFTGTKRFCNNEHKDLFYVKQKENKELDKEMESQGKIKEIKCTCNQCKHVWHYLEKDEIQIRNQQKSNALIGCGMCCNPFGAYFMNKSIEQGREADKFSKCPKCGSGNIKRTEHYYDKKT